MRLASSGPVTRPPSAHMFALLCARHISALKQSDSSAQRMPGILFAASDMPMPVPQISTPSAHSPEATARFVEAFAALEGPKLLVHGGGKLATRLAAQLGIESRMVDGRRITDRETLDVVTMVYAGLINKRLVAALSAAGCRAIGLSGADGNAVTARRRSPQPVDYGFVGDIERVDSALLRRLLEDGMAPVFSAIMHDGKGTLLNCNADSVASAVALGAAEIAPTDLVFCFEKAGVLRNPDDDTSLIREITAATYPPLKADGVVSKGMIPKIENALKAVEKGVRSVTIRSSENLSNGIGTVIRNS